MSPSTKIARIALSLLTTLLLSGLAVFGSSPASSYGLDFGARDYAHDGLTWFEPDPLASKYYHLSPYVYCAGNPLKFVDPEGKKFTKRVRFNKITIDMTIYTNENSYSSAKKAAEFWNSRKHDKYGGKKIRYNILVQSSSNLEFHKLQNENTYEVDTKKVYEHDKIATGYKEPNTTQLYVREDYSITQPDGTDSATGAHEIGHDLGMQHKSDGIMSKSQDEHRTSDVTDENISEMMKSSSL